VGLLGSYEKQQHTQRDNDHLSKCQQSKFENDPTYSFSLYSFTWDVSGWGWGWLYKDEEMVEIG